MQTLEVPLFPLNTVLFPGGVLPLRIFEPRYLDMVKRCMRDAGEFGVVLIREGREAGAWATTYDVGTLTQVVDFDQLPDKLLGITTRGTRRFLCREQSVQNDGLHVAKIELLAPEKQIELPDEYAHYAKLLEQALPQMGDFFKHLIPQYGDAAWVSGRIAEVLPIPLQEKQRLLEMDDPIARLEVLEPLIRGTASN
jgi:Lon protease-like protein